MAKAKKILTIEEAFELNEKFAMIDCELSETIKIVGDVLGNKGLYKLSVAMQNIRIIRSELENLQIQSVNSK